jgi:kynurenine formamidase
MTSVTPPRFLPVPLEVVRFPRMGERAWPRTVVDLSILVGPETQTYPGDPAPAFRPAFTMERDGVNVLALELGSHTGTHVDAPYHFEADGERLEGVELDRLMGPGVIADVTDHRDRQAIGWEALEPYADRLDPGTILIVRTGWSERFYGSDRYYEHPYLGADACERILERGVRTLAIDALNPDETLLDETQQRWPVHRLFLGAGGVIAENLTNLSAIDFPDPYVCLLPLRLSGDADGAPCRAVAMDLG